MKELMTYKSGKFYFSDKYDSNTVSESLVTARVLNESIVDLPILPALASQLEPEIMYSSIAGTASIEGNPITKGDVKRIAEGDDIDEYTQKDKQEIRNLIKAYNNFLTFNSCDTPFILEEELIIEIHKTITADIPDESNVPGFYRNGKVYVGDKAHGGIYTPPKILEDIKILMKEFISWINSEEILRLNPFIRAILAHYHFCLIHPFWDGNGRTARIIEAVLLQTANIKYLPRELSNYYYRNVDDYYISFSKSIKEKKDVTPFIAYCLDGAVESLTKIKESIIYFIRLFSLRDYYTYTRQNKLITKRQLDLLNLLTKNPADLITLKTLLTESPYSLLYRDVSSQTARRDLKKLEELNLISIDDDSKYFLNLRTLG